MQLYCMSTQHQFIIEQFIPYSKNFKKIKASQSISIQTIPNEFKKISNSKVSVMNSHTIFKEGVDGVYRES